MQSDRHCSVLLIFLVPCQKLNKKHIIIYITCSEGHKLMKLFFLNPTCLCVCVGVCMYICMLEHSVQQACVLAHIRVHACVHVSMHVYVWACVHMHACVQLTPPPPPSPKGATTLFPTLKKINDRTICFFNVFSSLYILIT